MSVGIIGNSGSFSPGNIGDCGGDSETESPRRFATRRSAVGVGGDSDMTVGGDWDAIIASEPSEVVVSSDVCSLLKVSDDESSFRSSWLSEEILILSDELEARSTTGTVTVYSRSTARGDFTRCTPLLLLTIFNFLTTGIGSGS